MGDRHQQGLPGNDVTDAGRAVRLVTLVGLFVNLVLAGLKFYAGYFGRSQSLIADGVHSLSDTISDVVIIFGSYYWTKPADQHHPYGHKRIETIVTIAVGLLLVLAGAGIIKEAMDSLGTGGHKPPKVVALLVACISIVAKELLYRWTMVWAKREKSSALKANAWHHRTDSFSSVPALLATASILIAPSMVFLDQVGALVISIFIFYAAYEIIATGVKELIDSGAPPETCEKIAAIASKVSGVREVHGVRTRLAGVSLYVDMHVLVDGAISVEHGHDIAEEVKQLLLASDMLIMDIVVHVEPFNENCLPEEL